MATRLVPNVVCRDRCCLVLPANTIARQANRITVDFGVEVSRAFESTGEVHAIETNSGTLLCRGRAARFLSLNPGISDRRRVGDRAFSIPHVGYRVHIPDKFERVNEDGPRGHNLRICCDKRVNSQVAARHLIRAGGHIEDRSYLTWIESGSRNPSVRSLLKIANALEVRVG